MNDACHQPTNSLRRRGGAVVAIGAAAGGIFAATLAHIAGAPAAHADEITNTADFASAAAASAATDIFTAIQTDVQSDITLAQSDLTAAVTDFSGQNVPGGLEETLAGLDNLLYAPGQTVGIDAIDYVVNGQDFGPITYLAGTHPAPDLATAFTQIETDYSTYFPQDFSQAVTYLEAFELNAVISAYQAFADAAVLPVNSLVIGSVDQFLADGGSLPEVSSGLGEFATLLQGLL